MLKRRDEIGLLDAIENSTRLRSVRAILKEMDMATQRDEMRALGARPDVTMFGVNGALKALAITDETAGGVVVPATAPTIIGALH